MGAMCSSSKSIEATDSPVRKADNIKASTTNKAMFGEMLAAWGSGEFASLDSPVYAKFMVPDVVFDASAAAGLHPIFKEYKGFKGFKEWLDILADNELADMDIKFVDGPKSAPNTIVQKVTVKMTNKATGKTMPGSVTDIIVWDYDMTNKITSGKIYFGSPESMAYVLDKDMPKVAPQPTMPVPSGVSGEKALEYFGKVYAAWGTGEFAKPETKEAAMAAMWSEQFLLDCTAGSLGTNQPGIFKLYTGHKGGDAWVNGVIGEWEMSGLDMTGEGVIASPTEGAVLHRFTSAVKHKGTGKEKAVSVDMVEWFFDADGKCTAGKFYWGSPSSVAALYPEPEPVPPAVAAFFNGEPQASKADKMPTLLADDYELAFIGPYAGATTGLTLDKAKMGGAAANLIGSFPDFTFNPTKLAPVKGIDGGWWAKILVHGTFTGKAFTPMPDKLPAIEPTGNAWEIGPEVFTVYPSEDGTQIKRITIEAQYKGALVGPPGIYVACGGTLPAPPPAAPPGPNPDCLMQAELKDFADWYEGFKAHATKKSFPMNGTTYTVPMSRGEACDEAKTLVFNDVSDANKVVMTMYALDFAKFGPVMADPQFVEMSEKAIVSQAPPLIMADPGPDSGPTPSMFFSVEVADVDKWIAGFQAHGSSKSGTWGYEVPITRGEFCDEAKTRVFKCATNPNIVGAYMEGVQMDKLGPLLGDEAMLKLTTDLGEKEGTKVMKVVTPMPPPPA